MTKNALGQATVERRSLDPAVIKRDFPILARRINDRPLVYLDNAATTQKPECVIRALDTYYREHNANVHRGLHTLADESTAAFELARRKVAQFIGGVKTSEVVFTRNATEAINLVAYSWGNANIKAGDRILLTQMEHHANLVPWLALAKRKGASISYIPIDENGYLILDGLSSLLADNTRIVAITHVSNVLGTINPVEKIVAAAHQVGAIVLVDGAQAVPHMPVDVRGLGVDFYAFSGHKMLGPTGVGVLYGKECLLEEMEPFNFGGEMISKVEFDFATWNELPYKFEAGTPDIAAVVAFAPALDYLQSLGMEAVREHEKELTAYALRRLAELNQVKVFGPADAAHRGGVVSFVDSDIHPHDLATVLDSQGIAIRAGHHCAQPLTHLLGQVSTARASFYIYNSFADIDELIEGLRFARRFFRYA